MSDVINTTSYEQQDYDAGYENKPGWGVDHSLLASFVYSDVFGIQINSFAIKSDDSEHIFYQLRLTVPLSPSYRDLAHEARVRKVVKMADRK